MAGNRTLTIIKPDAFNSGKTGHIIALLEKAGFKIIASRVTRLTQAEAAAVQSKEYLSEIRHQLGERLCEVKKLVARPGRGGGWSAFLAAQGIPRASADRYVQRYEKTLHPDSNCLDESIESTELAVRKLFAALWPRLRRVITSKEALDLFIRELTTAYDERAVHQCESGIVSIPALQPALEPVGAGIERVPE